MGRHLKNGTIVEYTVKPVYLNPISRRPDMFDITCNINGNINYWKVKND